MNLDPNEKLHLLIIDDETSILSSLRFLCRRHFHVHTANSGEAARELLEKTTFPAQIILCDQRMTGMQGHEFLQWLFERDTMPVSLLVTGYTDLNDLVSAINCGHIYGYIAKPWDPDELLDNLKKAASYYKLRRENHLLNLRLKEANESLEIRVKQRTIELETEICKRQEVTEKLKQSDARFRSLTRFTSSVVRNIENALNATQKACMDMNTRLTNSPIHKMTQLTKMLKELETEPFLSDHPKGKLLPEYIQNVSTNAVGDLFFLAQSIGEIDERLMLMNEMIQTQKDCANDDLGKDEIELNPLLDQILNLFRQAFISSQIEVQKELAQDILVAFPKGMLSHILINLIKNALESYHETKVKERRIKVITGCDEQGKTYLSITDNGRGLTLDEQDHVFTYGFTTKAEGHGFGLYFCDEVMREQGGNINIHSDGIEKGTIVTLYFP